MKHLKWLFDYYIGYFLYKDQQKHRYHIYMFKTYGDKYCTKKDLEVYLQKKDSPDFDL
jgi:hypothetical protein